MTRGITLVECLIYIALLTLLIISGHTVGAAVAQTTNRIHQEVLLLREGMFVQGLIRDELRESTHSTQAGEGVLRLNYGDSPEVRFEHVDKTLLYTIEIVTLPVTSPTVDVQAFRTELKHSAEFSQLEVLLILTVHGPEGTMSRRFDYLYYL